MHIAIDARIVNSTTGRYVERLIHYLQAIDTTNTYSILVPSNDKDYVQITSDNFSIVIADFDQYSLSEQIGFKRLLDTMQPDLVHFCMPQQPILYNGLRVTTFHDLTLLRVYNSDKNWLAYHIKQIIGRFVFKRVAHTSAHILTPTSYVAQDVIDFAKISPSKVTVTYEAGEVSTDTPDPYDHPFKHYIMYVGQQSDYKNIKRLIAAHQRLLKKHPDLGLILVGSLNASALTNKRYVEDRRYNNILFTGFVDDAQLNWLYNHTSAYVFPSISEGFGLPGLEAMGRGVAVISSNSTCLPEVYGEAAHYFNPLDIGDMAQKIDNVLSDKTLRLSLIKKGSAQFDTYSWDRMAKQTHDVYMDVLKTKSTNLPEQS